MTVIEREIDHGNLEDDAYFARNYPNSLRNLSAYYDDIDTPISYFDRLSVIYPDEDQQTVITAFKYGVMAGAVGTVVASLVSQEWDLMPGLEAYFPYRLNSHLVGEEVNLMAGSKTNPDIRITMSPDRAMQTIDAIRDGSSSIEKRYQEYISHWREETAKAILGKKLPFNGTVEQSVKNWRAYIKLRLRMLKFRFEHGAQSTEREAYRLIDALEKSTRLVDGFIPQLDRLLNTYVVTRPYNPFAVREDIDIASDLLDVVDIWPDTIYGIKSAITSIFDNTPRVA